MSAVKPTCEEPSPHATLVAERRCRRFHRSATLFTASLMLLLAAGCLVVFIGLAAMMFLKSDPSLGTWALVAIGGFVLFTVSSALQSNSLRCQLCRGKVLSDNGCRKHTQAQRLPLLTYRLTTALSVVFAFRFRCMYCGSRYRLWE